MKLAVLISGNGTNLQALIDAKANIVVVVSNRKAAYGLDRARIAGIPTEVLSRTSDIDRRLYDADLACIVKKYSPDLVVLAGWMHILSEAFLDEFQSVINLHPALPGEFPGKDAIKRAYEAYKEGKITRTGVMVHTVTPEVDVGTVLATEEVQIYDEETLDDLEQRMHTVEHRLLVSVVNNIV